MTESVLPPHDTGRSERPEARQPAGGGGGHAAAGPDVPPEVSAARLVAAAGELAAAIEARVLGQHEAVTVLLAAYIAGGHALLEGLPGLGKTRLARSFAGCLGARFSRVQFTPDLMPADLVGTNVFDAGAGFRLLRGPVFTDVLMADEINRTPPKTQSALLEAMQEGQVTIDGESHPLGDGFFVVATQNPIELEGVYPLPEAQLDRFLVRIEMSLPSRDAELELLRHSVAGTLDEAAGAPVLSPGEALALRRGSRRVHVAEELLDYLVRLAAASRKSPHVELGVSPRAVLALLEAARAAALIEGRDYAAPDDIKRLLVPCWAHRLILTPEAELEGHTPRQILEQAAASESVPQYS
ncbi:MAG: MoxR family ATPase [Acidobacteria bacterium]|nr:MoxR family ATPase [Acidobacteriota bacterium]